MTDVNTTEDAPEIHYQYQCRDCQNIGFILVRRDGWHADMKVCVYHIKAGDRYVIAGFDGMGQFSDKGVNWDDVAVYDETHRLEIIAHGARFFDFIPTMSLLLKQKAAKAQELEQFKEQVIEETVAVDGGCRAGKEEFLQSLGLEWPKTSVTITCTFEYSGNADDISSYDVEYAISSLLENDTDGVYVEIDY